MYAYLTVARYPKWLGWAGFLSMALFRFPLYMNKKATFYKLLGCGKNGTFDKVPDLQQWAVLMVTSSFEQPDEIRESHFLKQLHGPFISHWWKFFRCRTSTIALQPIEGHGLWDGKEVFGPLPKNLAYNGNIAVLTRATIRISKLQSFWKHVPAVATQMSSSAGFITSLGIGEIPWIKQGTFSIWENKESMKAFSYKASPHIEVIRKTRAENWYSEEMFVRFKIIASVGRIPGYHSSALKVVAPEL